VLFDTLPFILFLALTWVVWRAVGHGAVLLAASIVFYMAAGWPDLLLVTAVVTVNYGLSFLVARQRWWLAAAILLNLGVLAFFKYRAFLFGGVGNDLFTGGILIPLGISFYIFQIIAYQVDIVRGHCRQQRNFLNFALFILLFPQLIAGPIMRASALMPQVNRLMARVLDTSHRCWSLALGLILLGLFKKACIADSLAPHVDDIFARGPADAATAWLGAWLFTFQIYFDFSGYSDMAVGMARLFGIRLPFNFRQPYLARSPREFWQRWHVTLSQWIRDYLYIPLGGSRGRSAMTRAAVLVVTMTLAGLWHGADWSFMVWGCGWGAFIAAWRMIPALDRLPGLMTWAVTFAVAVILWVFFRSPDMAYAMGYFATMFGGTGLGDWTVSFDGAQGLWIVIGAAALLALHPLERVAFHYPTVRWIARHDTPLVWGVIIAMVLWLVILPGQNANPFIYFRF
jgi:alginate O-acetyltransferase complex protein AlgI